MMSRVPTWAKSLALWALALVMVGWVLSRIDLTAVRAVVKEISAPDLLAALLCLNLAQVLSARRMRYFLSCGGVTLPQGFAVRLYYVGMLYNLVLPGGIGGDGYKVWVLARRHAMGVKNAIGRLVEERASGLFALVMITLGFLATGQAHVVIPHLGLLLPLAAVACVIGYFVLSRLLFSAPLARQWRGIAYSIGVQVLTTSAAAFLLYGVHVEPATDYLLLFCIASILGVLPISVGGLGVRELVYWQGAPLLGLNPEHGVAVSLLFFAVYVLTALPGAGFVPTMRTYSKEDLA